MKRTFILSILVIFTLGLHAQMVVTTASQTKKVILEEFTGTGCPNCPAGHTVAAGILAANPGQVFVVAYHPTNSSYTTSDPMKDAFGDAFYSTPFLSSRFMPSAMVNRRLWAGARELSRTVWDANTAIILGETSPINVGLSSSYDDASSTLSIVVQLYFTSTVADALTLYCELVEDSIIANQSGGTSNYQHNHVFREAFVSQWGDAIAAPTSTGETKTYTFTFDNSVDGYNMDKCEVIAFVRNASDEEIITGNGAVVGTSVGTKDEISLIRNVNVYPNPVDQTSIIDLQLIENSDVTLKVTNMIGQTIYEFDASNLVAGQHQLSLSDANLTESGMYILSIIANEQVYTQKLIVE